MRKTLRGKRHIRARRTVAEGREKRRYVKYVKMIANMQWFMKNRLPVVMQDIAKGFEAMVGIFNDAGKVLAEIAKSIVEADLERRRNMLEQEGGSHV